MVICLYCTRSCDDLHIEKKAQQIPNGCTFSLVDHDLRSVAQYQIFCHNKRKLSGKFLKFRSSGMLTPSGGKQHCFSTNKIVNKVHEQIYVHSKFPISLYC